MPSNTEVWSKAVTYLSQKTLLWSNERLAHARADLCVCALHRELNYAYHGDEATFARVARNYCRSLLLAGRAWQPVSDAPAVSPHNVLAQ